MIQLKSARTISYGALFIFILGAMLLSRLFPQVHIDEVTEANAATNFIHGQGSRYSLQDNVAPSEMPVNTSNWNGRPLYTFWVSLWLLVLPFGWWFARFSSIAAGACLLWFVTKSSRTKGETLFSSSIATVLLYLHAPFWMASTVVNELIILSAATAFLIFFAGQAASNKGWIFFTLACCLLLLIHPFGIGVGLALLLFRFGLIGRASKNTIVRAVIGLLISIPLIYSGNPFLQDKKPFYYLLAEPPLLRFTTVHQWASQLLGFFIRPSSFYYLAAEKYIRGFTESIVLMWAAVAIAFVASLVWRSHDQHVRRKQQALWLGAFVTLLSLLAFATRFEPFYFVLLLPFSIPAMALNFETVRLRPTLASKITSLTTLTLLFISLCCFGFFVAQYCSLNKSHGRVVSELKALTGQPRRLMAPNNFWFDFRDTDFRESSVLVVARYFTEGRFEPALWLQDWHPDVLVVDEALGNVLIKEGNPVQALANHLHIPITYKGAVEAGKAYGTLHVLSLEWPESAPGNVLR